MKNRLLEAQDFSRRVNGLSDFLLRLESAKTREDVFRILQTESKSLLEFDTQFVALLTPNRSQYAITVLTPTKSSSTPNREVSEVSESRIGRLEIENPIPVEQSEGGAWLDLGLKSMLMVPLRTSEETLGSLSFGSYRAKAFGEADLWIAQLLGVHVAMALRTLSMRTGERKRDEHLGSMFRALNELSAILDPDELLTAIPSAVRKHFNYFDVSVFAVRKESNQLVLVGHSGNYAEYLPWGYKLNLGEGIIGWVATRGDKAVVNDVSVDRRYVGPSESRTKSVLAIPIRSGNEVVAVLNIEEPNLNAFDETDTLTFQLFCEQLGNAYRNATRHQEIRETAERLTELDKLKSEFVGIVSHDFRSPLSSIMLAARGLLKFEELTENKQLKEYVNIIIEQANRLNRLAEDTLSVTELESGQLSYSFKIINVERLVQDALALVKFSSKHKLTYHIDPNVAYVKGDQNKLRQVVTNLISNAVKYSPQGGNVTVDVKEYSAGEVLFSVKDEGVGIPDEQKDKLFRKFSRVSQKEVKDIRGAGLGLWISKEIVNAHGGRIWCESEVGKGSTFRFTVKKAVG